ncbi:MAG: DUF2202 domain-containing protein [Myxococcota bacterium]
MATPEAVRSALIEALEDEHKAIATYRGVIDRFGAVRPFVNLIASEQRHAEALERLCAHYDVTPPRPAPRVAPPASVLEACRAGVEAEIENAALYDRLIAQTAGHPDVQRVFRRLQSASRERHLVAFRRCVERESSRGLTAPEPDRPAPGRRGDGPGRGGRGHGRGGGRGPGPGRGRERPDSGC